MATRDKYRTKWTEEETILAFFYYCQIPFGKINKTNPTIIRLANLIGRTPSSVTLKMGNLGHFDPSLQQRNVVGMSNASKLDSEIVLRFLNNWEDLTFIAKQIENKILKSKHSPEIITATIPEGKETLAQAKHRINQQFFRDAVLSSYSQKCCITGIAVPELLIASHIKPWSASDPQKERTNPCNGLCLNALHDKAFDRGLITVLPNYTVRVSPLLAELNNSEEMQWLLKCDGLKIELPKKFFPSPHFLEYHNDMVFKSTAMSR